MQLYGHGCFTEKYTTCNIHKELSRGWSFNISENTSFEDSNLFFFLKTGNLLAHV